MTIVRHELRQGRLSLIIWTCAIGILMAICIFLYPEMKGEMDAVGEMFSSMGSFTAAFGMDRLNFGTLAGFYAIECGNVLGLGGALFASFIAVTALSKEEKDRTAEFLLTHPVRRPRIITEKLIAVMLQLVILNAVVLILSLGSMVLIGEESAWETVLLIHLAYFLLQVELAGICFGLSAFLRRGSMGLGLGLAAVMYFLNLMANLTESMGFLKYITPFGYCEGADIVADQRLNGAYVLLGMLYAGIGIAAAYGKYTRKDIA